MSDHDTDTSDADRDPTDADRDPTDADRDPTDADRDQPDLWAEIEDDVTAPFGDDVEVTVTEYSDHLDVRIMPNGAVSEIEAAHEDLTVVPYNACQMTIRTDD